MVVSILNTPEVFRLSNPKSPMLVVYDVTDLLPKTSSWKQSASKSAVTPHQSVKQDQSEEMSPIVRKYESIADILVKNDDFHQVATILSVSPYKNIIASYWGSYQKLFAVAFLLHVFIMSVYCYCSITYLQCPTVVVNATTGAETLLNRKPWGAEVGLALSLIWPVVLIIYDLAKLVQSVLLCVKVGFVQTVTSYQGDSDQLIGVLSLQASGLLYSVFAVVWYIMNRLCAEYQDYILALSYIFGWIYAINFMRGFKQVHHFSIILRHIVFKDMIRFSFLYLFILLAFSFAYAALIQAIPSLKMSSREVLFLVFNWMIGMSDFDTNAEEFEAAHRSQAFVQIIYAAYIILSTVVLLNLLIAMMSDSYREVREKSEMMWTVGSLQLPLEIEKGFRGSRYNPHNLRFDVDTDRWYLTIHQDKLSTHYTTSTATINELRARIDTLNNNFDHLLKSFEQIKDKN